MYVIGLTGGIASGKSAAAGMFGELGAAVIDTDAISHELTRPGGAAIAPLRAAFGPRYFTPDGALDRPAMRRLVFEDAPAKERLEAVLHPLIRAEVRARLARAAGPYVVVVVPLLLETGAYRDLIDRVLVVDSEEEAQVRRANVRSGLAAGETRAIMAAQLARAERLARADDVLSNDGSMEELRRGVARLHALYLDRGLKKPH